MRLECRNQKAFEPVIPPTAIYPWWQSGYAAFLSPQTTGTVLPIRRYNADGTYNDGLPSPFVNVQPWPVHAEGLRFIWYCSTENGIVNRLSDAFDVSIHSSRYGSIVGKPIPIGCVNTVERAALVACHDRHVYRLPAPFHVDKDENFSVGVFGGGVGSLADTIQVALRGRDPYSCQAVIRTATSQAVAVQTFIPLEMDDGRDRNVRSIDVHDVVFSLKGYPAGGAVSLFWIMARFDPPKGPKWTDDTCTSIALLDDQGYRGNTAPLGYYDMKFAAPLVMLPGDRVTLTSRILNLSAAMRETGGSLFAMLYGHQEVPRDRAR